MKKLYWVVIVCVLGLVTLFGSVKFQQAQQYRQLGNFVQAQNLKTDGITPERITRWCSNKDVSSTQQCTVLRYKVSKQQCIDLQKQIKVNRETCNSRVTKSYGGQMFIVQFGGVYEEPANHSLFMDVYHTAPYFLSKWL